MSWSAFAAQLVKNIRGGRSAWHTPEIFEAAK
jgi:hypothetical protein